MSPIYFWARRGIYQIGTVQYGTLPVTYFFLPQNAYKYGIIRFSLVFPKSI